MDRGRGLGVDISEVTADIRTGIRELGQGTLASVISGEDCSGGVISEGVVVGVVMLEGCPLDSALGPGTVARLRRN